jgi:hypothetical protein
MFKIGDRVKCTVTFAGGVPKSGEIFTVISVNNDCIGVHCPNYKYGREENIGYMLGTKPNYFHTNFILLDEAKEIIKPAIEKDLGWGFE